MAKQQVAKVEKVEAEPEQKASADAREVPVLKPAAVAVQSEGYHWREWLVRLPAEMILQDLNDPGIWRVVQQNPQKSLRALDRVTFVAHDQSWLLKDVIVVEADSHRVVLGLKPGDVIRMQAKSASWEDERHMVKWAGSGYGIFRRADDVQMMPQTYATIEAAKSVMFRQFYTAGRAA